MKTKIKKTKINGKNTVLISTNNKRTFKIENNQLTIALSQETIKRLAKQIKLI